MTTHWARVTHSPVGKCRLRQLLERLNWSGSQQLSRLYNYVFRWEARNQSVPRRHPTPREGRRQHSPAGQGQGVYLQRVLALADDSDTHPERHRTLNETEKWTLGSRATARRRGGVCTTLTGWLPWPGCELAYARAPNSIYILIKTAPLASPTPTRDRP